MVVSTHIVYGENATCSCRDDSDKEETMGKGKVVEERGKG